MECRGRGGAAAEGWMGLRAEPELRWTGRDRGWRRKREREGERDRGRWREKETEGKKEGKRGGWERLGEQSKSSQEGS